MTSNEMFKEALVVSSFGDEFVSHLANAIAAVQSLDMMKALDTELCNNAQHVVNVINDCQYDLEVILRNSVEAMNAQMQRIARRTGASIDKDLEAIVDYARSRPGQSGVEALDGLLSRLGCIQLDSAAE